MPYANLSHGKLYFEKYGEKGSFVLLVMGLSMRGRSWQWQLQDLPKKHQVIIFDNPGIGQSDPLEIASNTKNLARTIIEFVDSLGIRKFHLVGVSLGGMISQEIALLIKKRIISLSLLVTRSSANTKILPRAEGLYNFLSSIFGSGLGRAMAIRRLLFPEEFIAEQDNEWFSESFDKELAKPAPFYELLRQIKAAMLHNSTNRLNKLAGLPTLVVSAERDILVEPDESIILFCQIPGAKLTNFKSAGHGMIRQSNERLNEVLMSFFKENEEQLGELISLKKQRIKPTLKLSRL